MKGLHEEYFIFANTQLSIYSLDPNTSHSRKNKSDALFEHDGSYQQYSQIMFNLDSIQIFFSIWEKLAAFVRGLNLSYYILLIGNRFNICSFVCRFAVGTFVFDWKNNGSRCISAFHMNKMLQCSSLTFKVIKLNNKLFLDSSSFAIDFYYLF